MDSVALEHALLIRKAIRKSSQGEVGIALLVEDFVFGGSEIIDREITHPGWTVAFANSFESPVWKHALSIISAFENDGRHSLQRCQQGV